MTGIFLKEFAEVQFEILRNQPEDTGINGIINPSTLSTVGLRRASETVAVNLHNFTGIDIQIIPDPSSSIMNPELITNGSTYILKSAAFGKVSEGDTSVSLQIASSAFTLIGERETVHNLLITPRGKYARLYLLKPKKSLINAPIGQPEILLCTEGRSSAESLLSESSSGLDWGFYNAEPVVEWCMQNQRLRSNVVDLFSLPKGKDLLSNRVWSPEDETNVTFLDLHDIDPEGKELQRIGQPNGMYNGLSSPKVKLTTASQSMHKSNWLHPYLSDDAPEWADMTCMLRMDRERLMLPDNRWLWLDDWSVDVNGKLGKDTDADGWSYSTDFETFSNIKRYYERGANCRRRRWTRTVRVAYVIFPIFSLPPLT